MKDQTRKEKPPNKPFYERLAALLSGARRRSSDEHKVTPKIDQKPKTPKKKLGSKNKGQGQSKKRRKMAAASNRVNRKRIPGWKH